MAAPRGGAGPMRVQERAHADLVLALEPVARVSPLRHGGEGGSDTDVTKGRKTLAVEIKGSEATGLFPTFTAHGHHLNGRQATLWSQCRASGADVLLLSWKRPNGRRWWAVVCCARVARPIADALKRQHLEGRPHKIAALGGWIKTASALRARFSALLR